jgi:hypothetical protein
MDWMTSTKTFSSATARLIDSQASRMVDPISKLGASLLNRSFHGSLLLLFRLDVFLSNFHFTSRQFLGGHHIVDGLDAITQDLLFGYGSISKPREWKIQSQSWGSSRSLLVNT